MNLTIIMDREILSRVRLFFRNTERQQWSKLQVLKKIDEIEAECIQELREVMYNPAKEKEVSSDTG